MTVILNVNAYFNKSVMYSNRIALIQLEPIKIEFGCRWVQTPFKRSHDQYSITLFGDLRNHYFRKWYCRKRQG